MNNRHSHDGGQGWHTHPGGGFPHACCSDCPTHEDLIREELMMSGKADIESNGMMVQIDLRQPGETPS